MLLLTRNGGAGDRLQILFCLKDINITGRVRIHQVSCMNTMLPLRGWIQMPYFFVGEVGLDRCSFYIKNSFFLIFGQKFCYEIGRLLKTNSAQNRIGGTENIAFLSNIFRGCFLSPDLLLTP